MALNYLNYFAMIVGYTTIIIVILFILLFAGLILREKYQNWKWKKEQEKRQKEQQKEQEAKKEEQKESQKGNPTTQPDTETPNVQISIKQ